MALFGSSSYTVHVPPTGEKDAVFVADAFSLIAFLFAPLYFVLHRRWVLALVVLVLTLMLNGIMVAQRLDGPIMAFIHLAVAAFIGLEAPSLLRWSLARSGYVERGVVVAKSLDKAERRFFESGLLPALTPLQATAVPSVKSATMTMPLGLFPQAEPKLPR